MRGTCTYNRVFFLDDHHLLAQVAQSHGSMRARSPCADDDYIRLDGLHGRSAGLLGSPGKAAEGNPESCCERKMFHDGGRRDE